MPRRFVAIPEFIENRLRVGVNLMITTKFRKLQNPTNKIIREAKRYYFEKLEDKSIFGLHLEELLIRRSLQIFRPFLTIIFMLRISSKRSKFLMIIRRTM